MSGIYGVWNWHINISETPDIGKLKNWNKAYGKLSADEHIDDKLFIGCSYEKLVEAAPKSAPVINKDGKYAVIDALLYNRKEIIAKGDFSENLSDEELVLAYIEKFGFKELREVNGDFAGVIYDEANDKLTLFRDHMGVRPLFYYMTDTTFAFSTDIRGLVSMRSTDVSVDERWLWNKLAGTADISVDRTEFANIFCVKPASYMAITKMGEVFAKSTLTYWKPGSKKIRLASENAYIARHRELITDSVRRRLETLPDIVGAELSGGLDSSIIDILIHRLGREAIYVSWSAPVAKLSYAENDERLIVEDICRQENIECHYCGMSEHFADGSIINDKMRTIGIEPDKNAGFYRRFVFPPYISTLQIGQVAQYINSKGGKVVFTGHAGDEGVSHRANPYEMFYNREYYHYFKYMWDSTKGERHRLYKTVIRSHKNLTTSGRKLREAFVSAFAAEEMLDKDFFEKYNSEKRESNPFAYDPLSYVRKGGSRNRLDVVALLGAYCGARYIVPYLDYRVIDYALSIPRHMFVKNGKSRYIFREAFKDIMPESLYNLTGKEDTSWRNVEKKEKTEKNRIAFLERKRRLFDMLDRAYWDKYLNWDFIEEWVELPDESEEEFRDMAMLAGIDNCLSLQNLITFSRQVEG